MQVTAVIQAQNKSTIISENSSYIINSGNKNMTIDPKKGGRIASFKLGNYEFLAGKDIEPDNYGSTFWPSPQSNWNWPPPAVLDHEPYQVENKDKSIKVTSEKDHSTGFQFIKEFSAGKKNRLDITYSIVNIS